MTSDASTAGTHCCAGQPLHPDQHEFVQVRWWTVAELRRAGLDRFEPHLMRALDALGLGR
jgi:hypothetical protein